MQTVTLYHGTTKARAKRILREGLQTSHSGEGSDLWAKHQGESYEEVVAKAESRAASIFVTELQGYAEQFANAAADEEGGDPAVIELEIPKARFDRDFSHDEASYEPSAYRTEENIPAAWCKRVIEVERGEPFAYTRDPLMLALSQLLAEGR